MTNVEVIQRMYRAFAERDYDTFKRLCAPDLVWIQNEGFPNGASHVGPEAVVENVFKRFGTDWESFRFDVEDYLDAGNAIIVIGSYTGQYGRTGKSFNAAAAHVYELGDGKICRFRQFTDTKVIADSML